MFSRLTGKHLLERDITYEFSTSEILTPSFFSKGLRITSTNERTIILYSPGGRGPKFLSDKQERAPIYSA
jgi:hypothetical protein